MAGDVVAAAVLGRGADRDLDVRVELLGGRGQRVGGVVADEFQDLGGRILRGHDLDGAVRGDRAHEVAEGRPSSLGAVLQQGVDSLRQRVDAEELETAALRELLSRRGKGGFVGVVQVDARLAATVAGMRRAHGFPSGARDRGRA